MLYLLYAYNEQELKEFLKKNNMKLLCDHVTEVKVLMKSAAIFNNIIVMQSNLHNHKCHMLE
jgi:hypothetical protein